MTWLVNLLMVVQVLSALGVILLVLLQHGKGADMGAAFGGGASGSLFGASGSANFLSRFTAVLAVVFFGSTLVLAMFGTARPEAPASVMESPPPAAAPAPKPTDIPGTDVPRSDVPASPSSGASTGASGASPDVPAPASSGARDFGTSDIPK
ncbi:MAG TPA: preprotein translocase subunit SecG [Zeimonas sp.]|jgi:preprotein translocase subunit SecG|nr:preprotein translocase subunit SecG [Zeimonas sp.]